MGKGGGENCARELSLSLVSGGADERPVDYNSRELNFVEVTDQAGLLACVDALSHPDVTDIALDIETTGGLKPWQGSIRYIQVGVSEPEPKQFLLDMWRVSPSPILSFFEDPNKRIITCNGWYEQLHLLWRYGVRIRNMFDVCYTSREITKAKQKPAKERFEARLTRMKAMYDERIKETRDLIAQRDGELKLYKQMVREARKEKNDERAQVAAANVADVDAELAELKAKRDALKAEKKEAVSALQEQAPKPRPIKSDFKQLMRRYVGKKISKEQQTSAWDDEVLSEDQKRYAAMDVAGLLDIVGPLERDLEQRGLQEQAEKANEIFESVLASVEKMPKAPREDVDRLLRGFHAARSVQELDKLRDLTGRMSIAHHQLPEVDAAYTSRWVDLATAEAVMTPKAGAAPAGADDLPF